MCGTSRLLLCPCCCAALLGPCVCSTATAAVLRCSSLCLLLLLRWVGGQKEKDLGPNGHGGADLRRGRSREGGAGPLRCRGLIVAHSGTGAYVGNAVAPLRALRHRRRSPSVDLVRGNLPPPRGTRGGQSSFCGGAAVLSGNAQSSNSPHLRDRSPSCCRLAGRAACLSPRRALPPRLPGCPPLAARRWLRVASARRWLQVAGCTHQAACRRLPSAAVHLWLHALSACRWLRAAGFLLTSLGPGHARAWPRSGHSPGHARAWPRSGLLASPCTDREKRPPDRVSHIRSPRQPHQ